MMGRNVIAISASKAGQDVAAEQVAVTRTRPRTSITLSSPVASTATVRTSTYTLSGYATPGSQVRVGGIVVDTDGGRFSHTVALEQGRNVFWVRVDKNGFATSAARITVNRRLSAKELRDAFVAATTTIPYDQLIKSPDRYIGTKVRYYGEIFQIQENYGGGIMLLSVTDLGYGVWTDEIWVNYNGHIAGADGDSITVYGIVNGSKSYKTQIGGERYVPEISAKYIVE
jgi:hypothetical protein